MKIGTRVMAINGSEHEGWVPDPTDLGTVTRGGVRFDTGEFCKLVKKIEENYWETDNKELRVKKA